jgi:hypothetical protein
MGGCRIKEIQRIDTSVAIELPDEVVVLHTQGPHVAGPVHSGRGYQMERNKPGHKPRTDAFVQVCLHEEVLGVFEVRDPADLGQDGGSDRRLLRHRRLQPLLTGF